MEGSHGVGAGDADGRSDLALGGALSALAELYAYLVYAGRSEARVDEFSAQAMAAWLQWYETMPDAPCIAVCSTSQGDDVCRGCGRTFEEVQHWTAMTPAAKRAVWRRITQEGTALRFTRYKERSGRGYEGG